MTRGTDAGGARDDELRMNWRLGGEQCGSGGWCGAHRVGVFSDFSAAARENRVLGIFHTSEGSGGQWLAFGGRSGAAQVVSTRVLADGSEERAKESSKKKTYEVFFQGHSRLRRS